MQEEHAAAYSRFTQGFYAALVDARQVVGRCMAHVMLTVRPETLTFGLVAARFLEAAAALGQASICRICWKISSGARSIRARF